MSSNDPEAIDALFSTLAFVFKFLVKQIVMNFQARFARARKSLQSKPAPKSSHNRVGL